jgi:hypothetical protein
MPMRRFVVWSAIAATGLFLALISLGGAYGGPSPF